MTEAEKEQVRREISWTLFGSTTMLDPKNFSHKVGDTVYLNRMPWGGDWKGRRTRDKAKWLVEPHTIIDLIPTGETSFSFLVEGCDGCFLDTDIEVRP